MKPKKFVIKNPVYPFDVGVWIGPYDHGAIEAWAKGAGFIEDNDALGETAGFHGGATWNLDSSGQGALIWLDSANGGVNSLGIILHECVHATLHIGHQIGFIPSDTSSEFYTYFSQFLFERILEKAIK